MHRSKDFKEYCEWWNQREKQSCPRKFKKGHPEYGRLHPIAWGFKKWAFPFVVIGMNAISVYVATHLFDFRLIGNVFVGGLLRFLGGWADFIEASASLIVIWLILYWMYGQKIFIKI